MTPAELADEVLSAVRTAVDAGELPDVAPTDARIERPRVRAHGDYATGIAMQLAKAARRPPRDVAEAIAKPLRACPGVRTVEVAGPGFLNITLEAAAKGELARTVVSAGDTYGRTTTLAGQRINLEFVSANPTGPLHLGHTRWAAVGEALARSLQAAGAEVTKEYYFNDHGAQIDRFARSLLSRARRVDVPDDGYAGAYIDEIAGRIVAEEPGVLDLPDPDAQEIFRKHGVELMFSDIKQSLHEFGTDFDVFFHEDSLHESGAVERAVARLRELGHVYEHEGAVWLRTSEFGDDKDRVVIKSDGHPAYIAADLAYYLDKRERGFDRVIIMLGPDHHGYIGRLMAMCACFGDVPGENLEILIGQMVNMVRRGEPIRMSKRAGTVVTLEDLVDAIGVDAARYALIRSSVDANIDIDLDVWTKNTNDNPVFYVQYGHARISGVLRNARELGIEIGNVSDFRPELLEHEREGELLRALGEFPQVVATAAELREPHRVPRYLEELAGTFHRFYDSCRVLPRGDEETTELHRARLWLVEATRVVLKNGAQLVGITAPERM